MIPGSYSFLRDLDNCPHKAYRRFIKRDLPKEDTPELRHGNAVHDGLAAYINGKGPPLALPEAMAGLAAPLRDQGARAEVAMGMTKEMLAADYWKGDPWFRGKTDVLMLKPPQAMLVDWKTGKPREDKRELQCQALLVRANYPEISRITGMYVWLKEDRLGELHDLTDLDRAYHGTVAAMDQAAAYDRQGDWPKTPNALCGWCNVVDCEHRRER